MYLINVKNWCVFYLSLMSTLLLKQACIKRNDTPANKEIIVFTGKEKKKKGPCGGGVVKYYAALNVVCR